MYRDHGHVLQGHQWPWKMERAENVMIGHELGLLTISRIKNVIEGQAFESAKELANLI